jgi:hypothetical protein
VSHGSCVGELKLDSHDVRHTLFCLSRNNKFVAWTSTSSTVHLWEVATGSSKPLFGSSESITSIAFSPNTLLLATSSWDQKITIWGVETASCQLILEGYNERISQLAFSANNKLLASICHGHSIRLWDTETGQCRYACDDLVSRIYTVSFSSCDTSLQTNTGSLAIPASLLDRPPIEIQRPPCIFVRTRWIYVNETPVLWLPLEYRPKEVRISRTTILVSTKERKLVILQLDLDKLKRIYPCLLESTRNQDNTKLYAQSRTHYWLK